MIDAIPGTTLIRKIQVIDPDTSLARDISGWEISASWDITAVTPYTPVVTELDSTTRLLRADTTGLNGRTGRLRIIAVDPLSTDVVGLDLQVQVKR